MATKLMMELLRSGHRDSTGDIFPPEVVEDIVNQVREKQPYVTRDFERSPNNVVGSTLIAHVEDDGDDKKAMVQVSLTPSGEELVKAGFELAIGAEIVEGVDNEDGTRDITKLRLTEVSLVKNKVK